MYIDWLAIKQSKAQHPLLIFNGKAMTRNAPLQSADTLSVERGFQS
jgi:hypothetical protein